MEIREINEFIESEIKRLEEYYGDKDKNERTMATGFKLVEEVGELFEALLAKMGYQRKSKLKDVKPKDLEKEFSDVIFTTLILAKKFNIDIEESIKLKMEEVKNRRYND